ncbi:LLM class flavin-dependent oxidoreductase [Streptomyces sp. NPDC004838]
MTDDAAAKTADDHSDAGGLRTGRSDVKLGLLEYFDFTPDRPRHEKQCNAMDAALLADHAGYHRIWIPEHHGPNSPSSSPLLLSAALGTRVSRARVGTAVTLLRIRDPYLTAVDIAHVVGQSPAGFDLGIGRGDFGGPGSESVDHLRKNDTQFSAALDLLTSLLDSGSAALEPLTLPYERWMHGAGGGSAEIAGKLGFNYCHGLFLNPNLDDCLRQLETYRALRPDGGRTAVAMTVLTSDRWATAPNVRRRPMVLNASGTIQTCAEAILRVGRMTGADEIIVAEVSQDPALHQKAVTGLYQAVFGRSE